MDRVRSIDGNDSRLERAPRCSGRNPTELPEQRGARSSQRLVKTLTPELLAVEVARCLGLDLDVAFNLALAGESHFVFMADVSKECFRVSTELRGEVLDHAGLRDVRLAFFDVDAARATHAETLTVQVLVDALVELHACLAGGFPKVGTLWNVDGFFLFDERDLRHGPLPSLRVLMPEKPDIRWLTCRSEKRPATKRGMVRGPVSSFQTTFQVPISEKLRSERGKASS